MPVSVHREVERKYDAARSVELPSLEQLPGVAAVRPPVEQQLEAVYFDTPDLALAAAAITLRRRTGGEDAGWHLKRPLTGGDREELHQPLGRATRTVPAALRAQTRVYVRDQRLAPVATIRTLRLVHQLIDSDGAVLAEICDDTVTARTHPRTTAPAAVSRASVDGQAQASEWREWEVELVEGPRGLLDLVDKELRRAGATPAAGPSKLTRALGGSPDSGAAKAEPPVGGAPSRKGPARIVLHAHLREQAAELKARDPQVRAGKPDAVHKMRVATRRLRSALATFRQLLDRDVSEALRRELAWLAGVLGVARDAEVMRDRLTATITSQPPELRLGPVARRLGKELQRTSRSAHAEVVRTMDSDRYFRLLDALDALVADPPWTAAAEQPARKVLRRRVRKEWKRMRDQAASAAAAPPEQREDRLHDVRKSAKRVRYASEALQPVFGSPARAFSAAVERLQEALGHFQDSAIARERLYELGVHSHADGDDAFTYGRLHALEQVSATEAENEYSAAWQKVSAKRLRRWFD